MRMSGRLTGLWLMLLLSGCAGAPGDGMALVRATLDVQGATRAYYLYVPERVRHSADKVPLVVSLHGGGGNGEYQAMMTGFSAKAEQEGFIVVYPDGTGFFDRMLLTWNSGHCCAYAMRNRVDDIGFIQALIDHLVQELPVDPHRVYATGLSNGGMMAHALGIAMPDKIAAVAPVISSLFGDEPPPRLPVPAIIINGGIDHIVQPQGGKIGVKKSDAADAPTKPIAEQGRFWAAANGCRAAPHEEQVSAQVVRWRYDCPPGREVERYVVADNGHAWPGGKAGRQQADQPSQSFDATTAIWNFFKTKRR